MTETRVPPPESSLPEHSASSPSLTARLRSLTPARVGLGRTGVSLQTRDLLDFQRAHAQARDAVHARLDAASLASALGGITGCAALRLHSAAPDRTRYLQRPDLAGFSMRPAAISWPTLAPVLGIWRCL